MFSFIAVDFKGDRKTGVHSEQTESMDNTENPKQDQEYSRNNSSENGGTPNLPKDMSGDNDSECSELSQLPPEVIRLVCRHLPIQSLGRLEQVSR